MPRRDHQARQRFTGESDKENGAALPLFSFGQRHQRDRTIYMNGPLKQERSISESDTIYRGLAGKSPVPERSPESRVVRFPVLFSCRASVALSSVDRSPKSIRNRSIVSSSTSSVTVSQSTRFCSSNPAGRFVLSSAMDQKRVSAATASLADGSASAAQPRIVKGADIQKQVRDEKDHRTAIGYRK